MHIEYAVTNRTLKMMMVLMRSQFVQAPLPRQFDNLKNAFIHHTSQIPVNRCDTQPWSNVAGNGEHFLWR